MLKVFGVGLLLLVASASGAVADNMCGDNPIAPAIPSPMEIAKKSPVDAASAKHNAFQDIRRWQTELKTYRDCLDATVNTDKRLVGETQRTQKPDKEKIADLQKEIAGANHAYDATTDDEEKVVNDFNALSVAYCSRADVDRSSCPKR
jgi:hypothetical protein